MKIFSAAQVREWDAYTIRHKPIASVDLMEKAASTCYRWLKENIAPGKKFLVFCGNGNNGGDGLAIARMLLQDGTAVMIYQLSGQKRSEDCQVNIGRIRDLQVSIHEISTPADFPLIRDEIIIDAIFGTGLNKPLQGSAAQLVNHINQSKAQVISIDMPSGLFADVCSAGNVSIKAADTISFQSKKLACMFGENAEAFGSIHVADIHLSNSFYRQTATPYETIDINTIQGIYKPRQAFTHKYSYGHGLLFAGSEFMMGAAVLCATACLRSGAGLVTMHTTETLAHVLQAAVPEAISSAEKDIAVICRKKTAIGIGPGLTDNETNRENLRQLVTGWQGPLVIDATALAMLPSCITALATRKEFPAILTPHAGEFARLFGDSDNEFERMKLAMEKSAQHHCYIVLKGKNTLVACPDGKLFFNTTGNSGMATAGSGDVLTGVITGLLCQRYTALDSCLLGVYLHGLAGDLAAADLSEEAMIAGDITSYLGAAYKTIKACRK